MKWLVALFCTGLSVLATAAELPLVQKQQFDLAEFSTQSGVQLKQVKVGDKVKFEAREGDGGYTVTAIQKAK